MSNPECVGAGTAATTIRRPQAMVMLALVFVAGMALLLWYFAGVTFHGPDQIRDMAIARALVHDGVWPLTGPPLFGGNVFLPPAYYWLLALPLLLHDSEITVFVAFGTAFALSIGYVGHCVRQALGPDCALLYVLLAFPIFATSYTHSAWNPALTMTLSNLLLGLFMTAVAERKTGWLLLPWMFALLLQMHASAAPLFVGLMVYTLVYPRVLWHPKTLVSVATLALALAVWVVHAGWPINLVPGSASAGIHAWMTTLDAWLANLTDLAAWRDFALLPWNTVRSIEPVLDVATPVAGVHLLLLLGGLIGSIPLLIHNRVCFWLGVVAGVWLLIAQAFLAIGPFWYSDAVYPWLAVLAAGGWAQMLRRLHVSSVTLAGVSVVLFVSLLVGHLDFYRSWQQSGKISMRVDLLHFPTAMPIDLWLPGYTFNYLHEVDSLLRAEKICAAQLAGVEATIMRDITSRRLEPPCESDASIGPFATAYFMQRPDDSDGFLFASGLTPTWTIGHTDIYRVPYLPLVINGRQHNRLERQRAAEGFGFGFPPRRLPEGVRIDVLAPGQSVVLRVGLRCNNDEVVKPQNWTVHGATTLAPPLVSRREHFTWSYYDVEWQLQTHADVSAAQVISDGEPLQCDVTAVARSLTDKPRVQENDLLRLRLASG